MKKRSKIVINLLIINFLFNACFAIQINKIDKGINMKKIEQTAGRAQLGDFAPDFAHYNDDVLFGENWNNQDIDLKTRSIITVVSLISMGIVDNSLIYHLQNAKNHGVTKNEIASIITHNAFYAGWPKAWAAFNLAKQVWNEESSEISNKEQYEKTIMFPIGEENVAYSKYFKGKSYLAPISSEQVKIYNVTFEPKCRNNWHIHKAKTGGGQMLIGVGGKGIYQEWGKEPVEITEGTVINIPANVKHWHGAQKDSWFSHLAIEIDGIETQNVWLEEVSDDEYTKLHL